MTQTTPRFVRAARLADLQKSCCHVVHVEGHTIALFQHQDRVYAVDNRCPHMGFPLDRGTVRDGILVCHWHHARFDLRTGGAFDLWADDVRSFPVEVRDGEIWVDVSPDADPVARHRQRLADGLVRSISLVIGKSVIALLEAGDDPAEAFRVGLRHGVSYRAAGWGPGLTMLTCMANLLPTLETEDRPLALFHGMSAVAAEAAGQAPRFPIRPLPDADHDLATLKRWFRHFVEVRDAQGAERCIVSALEAGAEATSMADMLFAAATDHRYRDVGHLLDFTNKAFEALDMTDWSMAELVLTSLIPGYARASRSEESSAWRQPIDLAQILDRAFETLPAALAQGQEARGQWDAEEDLLPKLLQDDPHAVVEVMLESLRDGCTEEQLAAAVVRSAAQRIARFHTSNEFADWDTALHTFSFANAVHQAIRRSPSVELLRGVFDAAMSVYLDRFLNIPAARVPVPVAGEDPDAVLEALADLFDRRQQLNEAGRRCVTFLANGGDIHRLQTALGKLLLREDRNFHTIQMIEAAFQQIALRPDSAAAVDFALAATRYLAAHAPTMRAQGQTYRIAWRLHRGERIFEGDDEEA